MHGFAKLSLKMLPFEIRSGRRFRQFSSKMLPFQIRSGPQFRHFSSKMLRFEIRSGPQFRRFASKMLRFQIRSGPKFGQFSSKMLPFQIRSWRRFHWPTRGWPCRVGRQFAFSYSFSTTRPRFARAIRIIQKRSTTPLCSLAFFEKRRGSVLSCKVTNHVSSPKSYHPKSPRCWRNSTASSDWKV